MLKLKTSLDIVKYSPLVQHFSSRGVQWGTGRLNFGPPKISERTSARMLKLKTQLDILKYSSTRFGYKNLSARGV